MTKVYDVWKQHNLFPPWSLALRHFGSFHISVRGWVSGVCVAFLTPLTVLDPTAARSGRILTTGHFACRRSHFFGGGNYAICLRVSFSFFFCARFWNSLNILSDFLILGDSGSTTSKLGKAGWRMMMLGRVYGTLGWVLKKKLLRTKQSYNKILNWVMN